MENLNNYMFAIISVYLFLVMIVSIYGKVKKIGFNISFIWSLCFTPIIGLILVNKSIRKRQSYE